MVVSGLFHTIYWRLLIISYQCIYNVCLRIISYNFIIVLIWLNISHKIQSLKDGSRCSCVSFCYLQSIFWLLLRDWCVLNFPMFHSWIEPKSFLSKNKWGRPGLISSHRIKKKYLGLIYFTCDWGLKMYYICYHINCYFKVYIKLPNWGHLQTT